MGGFLDSGNKTSSDLLYHLMATLDLTADAHLQRRATSMGLHTYVDRFRARYDYLYSGKAVLATETATDVWLITAYPGVDTVQATTSDGGFTYEYLEDHIFYGSETYEVEGALAMALIDAGYTVTGAAFTSGFSTGFEV